MLMKGFETFLNIDAMLIYRIFFTMFAPYLYAELGTMRYTSTIWRILQINFWPRGNAIFLIFLFKLTNPCYLVYVQTPQKS